MTILDQTIVFHPEDDKTNRCISFRLNEDYDSLRIQCAYAPKVIADEALAVRAARASIGRYVPRYQLGFYAQKGSFPKNLVNLLTFSLDHEQSYLGCAHRHAPRQEHIISEGFSSPGFLHHRPIAGDYRAVINVHSITSPEVSYHLVITAARAESAQPCPDPAEGGEEE